MPKYFKDIMENSGHEKAINTPPACYCDYDLPEFYRASRIHARKEHKCTECGRTIRKGETYENVAGKWDFGFDTFKTCSYCLAIIDILKAQVPCFCLLHGGLYEELAEWERDYFPSGVWFAISYIRWERRRDERI